MSPEQIPKQQTVEQKIESLSQAMNRLGTGPLAELRRMAVHGPGTADFWHLAARCGFIESHRTDSWMRIVKIMAILTPRGEPAERPSLHDKNRPLGQALCDGGHNPWPTADTTPRPFLSETRLARLLAQLPEQRAEALERLARMLAAKRNPKIGINCVDIAYLLLDSNKESKCLRKLARTYYQCLDSATHKSEQEETTP